MRKFRFCCLLLILGAAVMTLCPRAYAYGDEDCIAKITVADAAFTKEQGCVGDTVMGAIVADSIRAYTGADIAAIPCGDFSEEVIGVKTLTFSELCRLLPENPKLVTARLSPRQLKDMLEYAVSCVVLDPDTKQIDWERSISDGFLQLSGMKLVYDTSAPVGERVYSVSVSGTELDLNDEEPYLLVSSTESLFDGSVDFPAAETLTYSNVTCIDAVVEYLAASDAEVIFEYELDRISTIGNSDDRIIDRFPMAAIFFVVVAAVVANILVVRFTKRDFAEPGSQFAWWLRENS